MDVDVQYVDLSSNKLEEIGDDAFWNNWKGSVS